jgi:hypothetical protein
LWQKAELGCRYWNWIHWWLQKAEPPLFQGKVKPGKKPNTDLNTSALHFKPIFHKYHKENNSYPLNVQRWVNRHSKLANCTENANTATFHY